MRIQNGKKTLQQFCRTGLEIGCNINDDMVQFYDTNSKNKGWINLDKYIEHEMG